jgi:hypothetical protein
MLLIVVRKQYQTASAVKRQCFDDGQSPLGSFRPRYGDRTGKSKPS